MKSTDGLHTAWKGLTHVMQTDARFTPLEQERLTAIDAKLDATTDTTREEDQLVLFCMTRYTAVKENY